MRVPFQSPSALSALSEAELRQLAEAEAAMVLAGSYAEWLQAAEAHDALSGGAAWRASDASPYFDPDLMRRETSSLARLRREGNGLRLVSALEHTLTRHRNDVAAVELYEGALAGTHHCIEDWQAEVVAGLEWLVTAPLPGFDAAARRRKFTDAARVYGRSALMLSGGATWGFFHLGVVRALFENGLLPAIFSGASTGAMVASGVCARNDAELAKLFADPDLMRRDGLLFVGLRKALQQGAALDPEQLKAVLEHNVGPVTFAEAHAHSGRAVNISVSPVRTRQKPRLLSHVTAPQVLLANAALASSALPGLFPAVTLEARDDSGRCYPYVPSERWVDGSLTEDLPKLRMARLHNVNHFIVSQTNPHVQLFVNHHGRRGIMPAVTGLLTSAARSRGLFAADLARRAARPSMGPLRQMADRAHALIGQDYRGDITIHPRFRWELLAKVVVNPTRDDLNVFIAEGRRAVWPQLPRIADQTRIERTLQRCVVRLSELASGAPS